jgi:protein gp37
MSEHTPIEWCDISLSPWWGCTRVSPGCLHCYMMVLLLRWKGGKHCGKGAPRLRIESFRANALRHNRRAAKLGRRVTVFPSMCDPLDAEVPIEWFVDFLDVIRCTPALTWLFLTKRPELWKQRLTEAHSFLCRPGLHSPDERATRDWIFAWFYEGNPPRNVWMMTSAEDQLRADQRLPVLLQIPAMVRGLSVEPMLGPIDFRQVPGFNLGGSAGLELVRRFWVIVGGESGHGARPMHPDWVLALRNQCRTAGVPFFFKQWGEWIARSQYLFVGNEAVVVQALSGRRVKSAVMRRDGSIDEALGEASQTNDDASAIYRVGKGVAGRLLDGKKHDEVPA